MKYYLDTEFHEYQKKVLFRKPVDTIELISIGIISEQGKSFYAICKDFNVKAAWKNKWLKKNVLLPIMLEMIKLSDQSIFGADFHKMEVQSLDTSVEGMNYRCFKRLLKKFGKTKDQIAKDIYDYINPHYREYVSVQMNEHFDPDNSMAGPDFFEAVDPAYVPNRPEFIAYYADYDWICLCWLYGRMIELPEGYPKYCRDLKQMLDDTAIKIVENELVPGVVTLEEGIKWLKKFPYYPTQENEHNALEDAKWNKDLHSFLLHNYERPTLDKLKGELNPLYDLP